MDKLEDFVVLDSSEARRLMSYFFSLFITKYLAYIVPPALLLALLTLLSDIKYSLKIGVEMFLILFLISTLIVLSASLFGVIRAAFQGLFHYTTPPHSDDYLELPSPFENIRRYRFPVESRGQLAGYLAFGHFSLGVSTLVLWRVIYEIDETPWTISRKLIHLVPSVISEGVIQTVSRVTNLPLDLFVKRLDSPTFIIGAILFFGPLLFFMVLAMWNFMYAIEVGLRDKLHDESD